MTISACRVYVFILRLHPREFRVEFSDEMLWIFDEQVRCSEDGFARVVLCARLLLDVLRSAFIQRALREQHQPELSGPQFSLLGSAAGTNQFAEKGLILFSSLFSAMSIALCLRMVISNF